MISASIAGVVAADRLHAQLPVLAVAALLRPVVAPHRADRVELLRLRLAVQAVLDVGAADRRGALRPQRQRATPAIGERVRLLLDDVGALARCADDQVGVLDPGRVDPAVAVERGRPPPSSPVTHRQLRLLGREDVVRAARRLERAASRAQLREERVALELGAERRRRAVARVHDRLRREALGERARRTRASVSQSPPGRSTRPTEPAKRTSPENRQPSAWKARWPGEWPGIATISKTIPATSSVSSPGAARCRPRSRARPASRDARSAGRAPSRRSVDRRAGSLREVGETQRRGRQSACVTGSRRSARLYARARAAVRLRRRPDRSTTASGAPRSARTT